MFTKINEQKISQLASVLNVLADPICMRIVLDLTRPASIEDLQRRLKISQPHLQRHLTQMQNGGLLRSERRGSEYYYSITDAALIKGVKLLVAK